RSTPGQRRPRSAPVVGSSPGEPSVPPRTKRAPTALAVRARYPRQPLDRYWLQLVELLRLLDLDVTYAPVLKTDHHLAEELSVHELLEEPEQAFDRAPDLIGSQVRQVHPITLTPISGTAPGMAPRSFRQASATAQNRSACPRPTSSRSTSKDGLPVG